MKDKNEFFTLLQEIDGRETGDMIRLLGDYDFNRFVVKLSQVPPEGEDSLPLIVRVNHVVSGFPASLLASPIRRTALEDLLTRKLAAAIENQATFDAHGVARRRLVAPRPGQKILPRSTIVISDDATDIRLNVLIPRQRGRLDGLALQTVFFDDLPLIVQEALLYCNMAPGEVDAFVGLMEDADEIRQSLAGRGLVAFIGEGSLLSRQPGADTPDYESEQALGIEESLRLSFTTPHRGEIRGAGISSGITLILGDAYSGRVELMRAIASGIYNHVPGDGREYIIAMPDAVYVGAEEGRSVQRVDIGCFLGEHDYTSTSAPAGHAQAASLIEAIEIGARVIVVDEADSCPGFLGADERLQEVLGAASPLVPLSARIQQMNHELGISAVVAGHVSVGSFIPVAHLVLAIKDGVLSDITKLAKAKWASVPPAQVAAYDFTQLVETARWIVPSSIDASSGRRDVVIEVKDESSIVFGRHNLSLGALHQIADVQQALTIGLIIEYARKRYLDQPRPLREVLDLIERDLSTEGLDQICRELRGDLARPRRYEIAAALNRLPSLRVSRAAI
jgi:predicted ABC-class ATPase